MGEQNEYTRTNIVEMEDGSFEEIIEDQSSLKSSVQAEFKAKMLEEEQKEQEVENRKEKAVIILSGGMDSGTLLFDLKRKYNVFAITFDYGQKHRKEIFAAKALCLKTKPKTPHQVMNLSGLRGLLKNSSSLLNNSIKVPDGHYEDETMKSTVVPNRNMIMLSIAIGYAIDLGAKKVFYAAHSGDHAIYPDCRPVFVYQMQKVASVCHYDPVEVHAPYLNFNKADILRIGYKLKVPYEHTWTCYNGRVRACGKCGSCQERLEAFDEIGLEDPLEYETD